MRMISKVLLSSLFVFGSINAFAESTELLVERLQSNFNTTANKYSANGVTSGAFGAVQYQCEFGFEYNASDKTLLISIFQTALFGSANMGSYLFAANDPSFQFFGRYSSLETRIAEDTKERLVLLSKTSENKTIRFTRMTYEKVARQVTFEDPFRSFANVYKCQL